MKGSQERSIYSRYRNAHGVRTYAIIRHEIPVALAIPAKTRYTESNKNWEVAYG